MNKEIKDFYQLEAWQTTHTLVLQIYKLTRTFPKDELYGIVTQLRRAALSISANIAEGFERYHFNDKARFYLQARGSAGEVQNFFLVSRDLGYIDSAICEKLMEDTRSVRKLINGLIRSIEKQQ